MSEIDKLRFPIGYWKKQDTYTKFEIEKNIKVLEDVPRSLGDIVSGISEAEENLTYRKDSWTVKEVVNHLVDSHMNSYIRFKLGATEKSPTIKTYDENLWALTNDYNAISTKDCVLTLRLIHNRMIALFTNWTQEDWDKDFYHPGRDEITNMAQNLGLYAWHSEHHLTHVKIALEYDN